MTDDEKAPPSFRPRATGQRPDSQGARPVGSSAADDPRRAHRRAARPAGPQASGRRPRPDGGGDPPSFQPSAPRTAGARARTELPASHHGTPPAGSAPVTSAPPRPSARPGTRRRRHPVRTVVLLLLVLVLAWPIGLAVWANGKIHHVSALSGAADTPGTTYLVTGSDARSDGVLEDGVEGQRADTIMLLHVPESGPTALVSLPRDSFVEIPGNGANKLNASFSVGGPPLLVRTVENLTGLTVDHYAEIGMGGVQDVVDAVGGVELCLDYDVDDDFSGLRWTAGCRVVDGATALAFSRMRYEDPQGDIGRTSRQRQVVGAVMAKIMTPAVMLNPLAQLRVAEAGTDVLTTDEDSGIVDLARMALAFRAATGTDGIVGTPPVADYDYRPGGIGSTVLLADDAPAFFDRLAAGELTPEDVATP